MRENIDAGLRQAMLKQDKRRISTLRLMNAAIKDRDIAARTAGRDPVGEEELAEILAKMIKQRLESAKLYEEGNRLDLAEQEREEIAIIKEFLPKQLSDDEIRSACAETIRTTGAQGLRDMGRCMQALKADYAGRMDFGVASRIVKEHLA